jgi:hypothetical protein
MNGQFREGENVKKRPVLGKTGSQEGNTTPEILIEDEIDPADFFDPEEFGFRRRVFDASRP